MRTGLLTSLALPVLIGMAALAAPATSAAPAKSAAEGGAAAGGDQPPPATVAAAAEVRPVADIERRVAQFRPTPLSADLSALGEQERRALAELVEAARPLDQIFLRQAWTGHPDLRPQPAPHRGQDAAATLGHL